MNTLGASIVLLKILNEATKRKTPATLGGIKSMTEPIDELLFMLTKVLQLVLCILHPVFYVFLRIFWTKRHCYHN